MSDPYDPFEDWLAHQEIDPLAPPPGTFERITRSAHRVRRVRSLGAGFAVLLLAVGVATVLRGFAADDSRQVVGRSDGISESAPDPTGQTPTPPGADHSPKPQSPSPDPTGPGGKGADESSSPATNAPGCRAAQLRVAAKPGGGVSGHLGLILSFTNTGSSTCTMFGYPGVSFVTGEAGQRVGAAAARASGVTPVVVELGPGQVARTTVIWPNPDPYPEETCRPGSAAGLRIYPPDETTAIFAPTQQRVCTGDQVAPPEIYPVQRD